VSNPAKPIIYYDGYCHLCNGSIRFVIKRDRKKQFSYFPLQSEEKIRQQSLFANDKNAPSSIILVAGEEVFQKSNAVLQIFMVVFRGKVISFEGNVEGSGECRLQNRLN